MKNLPDGVYLEVDTTAAGGTPETCHKCGAEKEPGGPGRDHWSCGSYKTRGFPPHVSDLCLARSEIATLKIDVALWRKTSGESKDVWDNCVDDLAAMRHRAEKAEAERDEARSKGAAVEEIAALKAQTSHTDWKTGREFAELQSEIIVLKARLQDVQSHLQGVESDRRGILIRAEKAEAERDEALSKNAAVEEIIALKAEIKSCSSAVQMMTNLSNDWRIRAEDAQAKIKQLESYPMIVACDPAHPETYVRTVDVVALRERADRMESERDTAHQELATLKAEREALVTAYNEEMNDASQDVAALPEWAKEVK